MYKNIATGIKIINPIKREVKKNFLNFVFFDANKITETEEKKTKTKPIVCSSITKRAVKTKNVQCFFVGLSSVFIAQIKCRLDKRKRSE